MIRKEDIGIEDVFANRFAYITGKEVQVLGVDWRSNKYGFGRCEFLIEDGVLKAETEHMGKEFAEAILDKLKDLIVVVD